MLAPALGESWSHACTNRVMLDWQGVDRVASMLKSPSFSPGQFCYQINQHGVRDAHTQLQQQQLQQQQQALRAAGTGGLQQQQLQQQQQHQQQQMRAPNGAGSKRPFSDTTAAK
jgi:RAD51-like protein 2